MEGGVAIRHVPPKAGNGAFDWIKEKFSRSSTGSGPLKPSREIRKKYLVERLIERGGHGDVWLLRHKETSALAACKVVDFATAKKEGKAVTVQREVQVMRRLSHGVGEGLDKENPKQGPGCLSWAEGAKLVVELKDVVESRSKVEILMEYCDKGDLHDLILQRGPLPEEEARHIFSQLVLGLDHCHSLGVLHRDVKAENVLLTEDTQDSAGGLKAKLCDFGLAAPMDKSGKVAGSTGSHFWLAPEVVQDAVSGTPTDVWSLGLVLYAMLTGNLPRHPQRGRSGQSIWQKYYQSPVNMEAVLRWESISPAAQDLLRRMLRFRPEKRISVEQILSHPWVAEGEDACGFSTGFSRTSSLQSLLPLCSSMDSQPTTASFDVKSVSSASPQGYDWKSLRQLGISQGGRYTGDKVTDAEEGNSWHGSDLVYSKSLTNVLLKTGQNY